MGQVGIVAIATRRTVKFTTDRTGSTAKALGNGSDTALVVPHGHHDGALLCRQMGIDFRHRSTLQQRVLHLVLETAKIEWQLSHEDATRILNDVKKAAELGDWGARALLAHLYIEGLGPLASNEVLKPDAYKSVEIARLAAEAMQPWGLYDLGVAYEHGYGGAPYDVDLAWAYYLKAAQLGNPEAQMALALAYSEAGRRDDEI